MMQMTAERLLQFLEDKHLIRNRPKAEAMLLCQENMPKSIRWAYWIAFSLWLIMWVAIGISMVIFSKQDWGFYGYFVSQILLASLLYCWPHRRHAVDALLNATLVAIGLSVLLLLLPIPIEPLLLLAINLSFGLIFSFVLIARAKTFRHNHPLVLSGFCVLALLVSFFSSPLIIYSLVLLLLGMDIRKMWISLCGMILLACGLSDVAYTLPVSFKLSSLIFIVGGLVFICLPFFWHKPAKKVSTTPAQES